MAYLERELLNDLVAWKNRSDRKPLILKGARQVGKTRLLHEFGMREYEDTATLNCDKSPAVLSLFEQDFDTARIIRGISAITGKDNYPGRTLIIMDEVQEVPRALQSLKYFCEEAPEYHIIAAGSLLGVAVKKRKMTVPVGKVKIIDMYPISFKEFLLASDARTYEYIESLEEISHLPEIVLNKLRTEYRRYQVSGGMPEAVMALLDNQGISEVESALQDILDLYELDFSKYAEPREIPRIHAIWHSLPAQLSKENRKFIYKVIKTGARSKDYEDALMWLEDAGMIYRVYNISKPGIPLSAYEETDAFKVYACDCGLLRRLAHLPATVVTDPIANYTEFKGAMAENAVLQSIMSLKGAQKPYYWTSPGTAEVEFVIQWGDEIIPIEVKAEENISGSSLSVYFKTYAPHYRMRFSMLNLQYNEGLLSCPAPLAGWLDKWMSILYNVNRI